MNRIALAFVGLTLAAAPALAQNSNMSTSSSSAATSASSIHYMTAMKTGDWRASKLKGVNVYNNANEKIGDINEILVDSSGKIDAVIIGVGGFLGMGEHDVAVGFSDLKPVMNAVNASNSTSSTTTTSTATNTAPPRTSNDVTGSVQAASDRGYPDHFLLDATKDQLKAAPQFKYSTSGR
jgi:sporulation protein YlmC with PRC-barrel domain